MKVEIKDSHKTDTTYTDINGETYRKLDPNTRAICQILAVIANNLDETRKELYDISCDISKISRCV